jgi:hypothetical protein
MKRHEFSALRKALKLPGMQSHITRKAASWRVVSGGFWLECTLIIVSRVAH